MYVSAKVAIARFSRKFKPNSDSWANDALEWIGDALGYMHLDITKLVSIEVDVVQHRAVLPCLPDHLAEIQYECCYLPIRRPTRLKTCNQHTSAYGHINGCYLNTSFEEGKIKIHYYTVPVGEDNFPMIPRESNLIEALTWYMLREWISQGNKHSIFGWGDADANWEKYYPRAVNAVNFPKLINQDAFSKMWIGLIPNIQSHKTGFIDVPSIGTTDNEGGFDYHSIQ